MQAATRLTIDTITADSVSKRSAQATSNGPEVIQLEMSTVRLAPPSATSTNRKMPKIADRTMAPQVTSCAGRSPIRRPPRPAIAAPRSGRKMMAAYTPSAFHLVDVFDRDGAAVAEIDHQDREPDRGLGGRDRQHEHGEQLADHVVQEGREGDEVQVDGEQDQLDRHQDDDDVLPVQEDAEDPEREQDRADGEVVAELDRHHTPPRVGTLRISRLSSRRRPICWAITWRRTPSRERRVSTIAPIIATRRTNPAA